MNKPKAITVHLAEVDVPIGRTRPAGSVLDFSLRVPVIVSGLKTVNNRTANLELDRADMARLIIGLTAAAPSLWFVASPELRRELVRLGDYLRRDEGGEASGGQLVGVHTAGGYKPLPLDLREDPPT